MPEPKGWKNAYECGRCTRRTVTVAMDWGATPFIMRCPQCGGEAQSQGQAGGDEVPTHGWYRPSTDAEFHALSKGLRQHVCDGGLLLATLEVTGGSGND